MGTDVPKIIILYDWIMGKVQDGVRLGYEKAGDMGRGQLHLCLGSDEVVKRGGNEGIYQECCK